MDDKELMEKEALVDLQKFAITFYNKGVNECLLSMLAGVGVTGVIILGGVALKKWKYHKEKSKN